MTTAVDSSVLIAILQGEPTAAEWVRTLAAARTQGRLVCCEIVYAKVGVGFATQ
jgi:predicted nucleic acid-binding protein